MIYFTGDTHGDIDFIKLKNYFNKEYVTEKDYLFILGDSGIVWSEDVNYIDEFEFLGPTVFIIDGNHENFKLLNKFPLIKRNGAKMHRLAKNVYHVNRGEIVEINKLTFLCLGGATSIDKEQRIKDVSWWEEENIKQEDMANAFNNLARFNNKVDYVLTHTCPQNIHMNYFHYPPDINAAKLEEIYINIDFKYWYFGHYHVDKIIGNNIRVFYQNVERLEVYDASFNKNKYKSLVCDYEETILKNRKSWRKTKYKIETLPEWYYISSNGYGTQCFSLLNVTDIAYHGSPFDNHIDKDSSVYLAYDGIIHPKDKNMSPINREDYEVCSWRCSITNIIKGLEKYSPSLKLDKIKEQINYTYDQYYRNSGNWYHGVGYRPYPEIKTKVLKKFPILVKKHKQILCSFENIESAKKYINAYFEYYHEGATTTLVEGNKDNDYLYCYYFSAYPENWLYICRGI